MTLNHQFEGLRQSATVAMNDRILAYKAAGNRVVQLQVGDPDFATPPAVLDVAFEAMQAGLTHYGPSRGTPDLRSAAASKLSCDNDLDYDLETEILVTHGGIHAYYLAMQSILNPGDEVLIPDPTWATHANMATMLRGKGRPRAGTARKRVHPTDRVLGQDAHAKNARDCAQLPVQPDRGLSIARISAELQDFAGEHDLWVVSDEVYENLYYGEKPTSAGAFPGAKERTLLVHSLSKTYAMTGWRAGYLAGPKQVIENALKASQNSITCVAPFVQKAAAFALTDPGVQAGAAEMRAAYARRRDLVLRIAAEYESEKVRVTPPMGAFYFFLDFRPLKMTAVEVCERILAEAGVGLVPGSAFGDQGEGFVRMTVAASDEDVEAGFRSILEWAEKQ